MKTLIIVLIIAAFLQTTILPIDLVLLILICRAYIVRERANLYLAFAFGLTVAFLSLANLGFASLIYLGIVQATQILSKTRLAGHPLLIVPISLVFLSINLFLDSSSNVILGSLLSLPIFYSLRLWEERFVVKREIKLRV